MTTPTSCTCLDSPNMLYSQCQWCDERDRQKQQQERTMSEALKVGDRVLATWIDECGDKQTVSGTVANLSASGTMAQIDYLEKSWVLLPLSNLQRIPPSQAEPVASAIPNWPPGAVADITAALDAEFERKMEAKEPWKPVVGMKALTEVTITEFSTDVEDEVFISIRDGIGRDWATTVPLSQLRPLPEEREVGRG